MESFWAPTCFRKTQAHPRQVRFEAQRVRMLLGALGLASHIPDMINRYGQAWGERRLTFETFHEFFPTFPWMLEAQSFYATSPQANRWAGLGALMTKFK